MNQNLEKDNSSNDLIKTLVNLGFNIVLPVLVLTKFSTNDWFGPFWGMIVALSFPLSYGLFSLLKERKWNLFSIIGIISVLLTGGLALLKLEGFWFAVKESAIPLIMGILIVTLQNTKYSISKLIFLNPKIFKVDLINSTLMKLHKEQEFKELLRNSTWLLASSFLLSAILNFMLAHMLLKSEPGSLAFNNELGKMTALSFPVIMLPCMLVMIVAIFYLSKGMKKLTGLSIDELIHSK